jgi:hypothetical protein
MAVYDANEVHIDKAISTPKPKKAAKKATPKKKPKK